MNSKCVQVFRLPSLLLAAALQVLPIVRAALPAAETAANALAIIFRWGAGMAAALGGVHAVSGASTVITNPLNVNATNGVPFNLRLTTAPDQAHYWEATGLPANLVLTGTSGQTLWQIQGTPAVIGTYTVGLTAKDQATSGAGRTVTATLTIHIFPNGVAPVITNQPTSLVVTQGQAAGLSVGASGSPPLTYFWRNGTNVVSISANPTFTIANAQLADAGSYSVIVSNSAGTATSSPATLTVIASQSPYIIANPTNRAVFTNSSTTFSVTAGGASPLVYQWYFANAPVPGQTSSSYTIGSVQPADVGSYFAVVTNSYGSATSAVATLSLITPPLITASPQSRTNTAGSTASFSVTATSAAPLFYQWLKDGTNLLNGGSITGAQSNVLSMANVQTNQAGNYSVIVSNGAGAVTSQVAVLTVVVSPAAFARLVVQISGSGSVNPNYNGQMLQVGRSYSMTASPGSGYVFVSWSGGVNTNMPTLNFVMQSNLVLRANFVSATVKFPNASYNGLFYEAAGVSQQSSGFFMARITSGGGYSAKMILDGRSYSLSGQFTPRGNATNSISRPLMNPVTLELAIASLNTDQITGRVMSGSWTAGLIADRAVFDSQSRPASQAGSYTFVIPGIVGATNTPAGQSYGSVLVDSSGRVRLKGVLADGSKLAQSATLSKSGEWPLYATLYSGAGSVLGWVVFTNQSQSDLGGLVSWIKGQQPSDSFYPMGFDFNLDVTGSRYVAPAPGIRALNVVSGVLALTDGNLSQALTNQITIGGDNHVSSSNPALNMSIKSTSGTFKGRVMSPETGKTIRFGGVLLQKQNMGGGFFTGTNLSGSVYLGQ